MCGEFYDEKMALPNKLVQALLDRDLESAKTFLADFGDINQGHQPTGWTVLHFTVENNLPRISRVAPRERCRPWSEGRERLDSPALGNRPEKVIVADNNG